MRFLLDTNVVSETMRASPNRRLLHKLGQHDGHFAISVITWYELVYGVRKLPDGARKVALEARLRDLRMVLPSPLPVSFDAVDWLGGERARLEARGLKIDVEDALIAATAWASNLTLVTANTKHFSPFLGLEVVDWTK